MKKLLLSAILCMATSFAAMQAQKVPALQVGDEVPVALRSGLIIQLNGADGIAIDGKSYPLGTAFGAVMADESDVANVIVENSALKAWITGGTLHVESYDKPVGLIRIFNIAGQSIRTVPASGGQNVLSEPLGLPKGFYIVKINGKAYKLLNR
jgi:hypothetical protein